MIPVSFLDKSAQGTQLEAALAISYAVDRGASVINCSWGFKYKTNTLYDAIKYAYNKNVVVIAAVGNNANETEKYPAGFEEVLAVSSVDNTENFSSFSNFGYHVDFALYGERVYGLMPANAFSYKSGTSQSAAVLSGIVSRVLAYDNTITPSQMKVLLQKSSKDINIPGVDQYTGYGIPQPQQIMSLLNIEPTTTFQRLGTGGTPPSYDEIVFNVDEFNVTNIMNFPNPIPASGTKFGFNCTVVPTDITISVYDITGKPLRTLEEKVLLTGYQTIEWDGTNEWGSALPNGTYFYTFTAVNKDNRIVKTNKLSILR